MVFTLIATWIGSGTFIAGAEYAYNAGGMSEAMAVLPEGHFKWFSPNLGGYPALKAFGYFLATLMLLMGEQSMYQKFYTDQASCRPVGIPVPRVNRGASGARRSLVF